MPALDSTVKGVSANSYVSVAEADVILDRRLYATAWTSAGTAPNAANYVVSAGGASSGATSVPIEGGSGNFTAGSLVTFAGDETLYTVNSSIASAGNMSISPALAVTLSGGEAVSRESAYEKEKALMWATSLLDQVMVWNGLIRTDTQALRWPRTGVLDPDGNEYDWDSIPTLLKAAVAELALSLLESNKFTPPAGLGQGVSEVQAGPLKVKIDDTAVTAVISDNILAILDPLGYLESQAQKGSYIIGLERS